MYASDYLRMKFQSDRQLAIYGQRGAAHAIESMKNVASDIYKGIERVSWYSSCLLPNYHSTCRELMSEDYRFYLSVKSVFKYDDIIQHIIYLYLKTVLNDVKENNEREQVRRLDKNLIKAMAHIAAAKTTRMSLIYGLSGTLAKSDLMTKHATQRLANCLPAPIAAFQFIGVEQHAILAARRLKALNPEYYWALYHNEVEMLYYFVEPLLTNVMKGIELHKTGQETDIINIIKDEFDV